MAADQHLGIVAGREAGNNRHTYTHASRPTARAYKFFCIIETTPHVVLVIWRQILGISCESGTDWADCRPGEMPCGGLDLGNDNGRARLFG